MVWICQPEEYRPADPPFTEYSHIGGYWRKGGAKFDQKLTIIATSKKISSFQPNEEIIV